MDRYIIEDKLGNETVTIDAGQGPRSLARSLDRFEGWDGPRSRGTVAMAVADLTAGIRTRREATRIRRVLATSDLTISRA